MDSTHTVCNSSVGINYIHFKTGWNLQCRDYTPQSNATGANEIIKGDPEAKLYLNFLAFLFQLFGILPWPFNYFNPKNPGKFHKALNGHREFSIQLEIESHSFITDGFSSLIQLQGWSLPGVREEQPQEEWVRRLRNNSWLPSTWPLARQTLNLQMIAISGLARNKARETIRNIFTWV